MLFQQLENLQYIYQKHRLNYNSIYPEDITMLPKYRYYFSITMVILESRHFHKKGTCLALIFLNLNLMKFPLNEWRNIFLFFSCFSSVWSKLHPSLNSCDLHRLGSLKSLCFGKLVSTENVGIEGWGEAFGKDHFTKSHVNRLKGWHLIEINL